MSAAPSPATTESRSLAADLSAIVGPGNLVVHGDLIDIYSVDFSETPKARVEFIVKPTERSQVPGIVKLARRANRSLTVRGGGMSYTLGYLPEREGSIMIDTSALDRVIEISTQDMYITVEPGCTWAQLYHVLDGTDYHIPFGGTMSGERATVGGAIGNNATAVKRGEVVDYVLGMEIVLADGEVIQTGSRATGAPVGPMRNYGPDLTGIFMHDAGIMGVKTQITLRIERKPGGSEFATFGFQDSHRLIEAMCQLCRQGLVTEHGAFSEYHNQMFANEPAPDRAESLAMLRAIMHMAPTRWEGMRLLLKIARPGGMKFLGAWKHSLFVSTDGHTPSIARQQMQAITRLVRSLGGTSLRPTLSIALRAAPFYPVERLIVGANHENNTFPSNRLTSLSHAHALYDLAMRFFADNEQVMTKHGLKHTIIFMCVHNNMFGIEPIIFWRDAMTALRAHILTPRRRDELLAIPPNPASRAAAIDLRSRLARHLNQVPGAHYQIGKFYPYTSDFVDEATASSIRRVKQLFDPQGIMNPGGLGL